MQQHAAECDLIFMDIRLNDGLSLDIFSKVTINAPVIFITAYNDYALQAFKANGIDYIMKPFDEKDLEQALARYRRLTSRPSGGIDVTRLQQLVATLRQAPTFRQSFLVHFRDRLMPLTVEEIAWFYTAEETSYAVTSDNKKYIVEGTLEQLQDQLDPKAFFRVNRQFIIHRRSIVEISLYFNGRLLVKTVPESPDKMLISKARVPEFKAWMNA
jgi:two-component system LytT family response regulator